jgi:hypothetical protein
MTRNPSQNVQPQGWKEVAVLGAERINNKYHGICIYTLIVASTGNLAVARCFEAITPSVTGQ